MRVFLILLGIVLMLATTGSASEAQKPKKKKKNPNTKQRQMPPSTKEARLSAEFRELLIATSSGYELNGQAIAAALDVAAILKAANSGDPKVQEVGRLYCDLAYLSASTLKRAPDPEIARIAQADLPLGLRLECVRIVSSRVAAEELTQFGLKAGFMENLLEQGRQRGQFAKPDDSLFPKMLDKALDEALRQSIERSELGIVGLAKGMLAKERIVAMMGTAESDASGAMESIDAKLETTQKGYVVAAVTNKTASPLRNCLLLARSIPNPKAVERQANSEIVAINLLKGLAGVELAGVEADKTKAYVDVLYRSVLRNMERGGIVFVPEIPASGTVRVGLIAANEMVYVNGSEISLWCDELTLTGVSTGTWAGFSPELKGEPLLIGDKPAIVQTELTSSDPRDPQASPEMKAKVCKVFRAAMSVGKTYIIESTAASAGNRLLTPPLLRVEDEHGKTQATDRERSLSKGERIVFKPTIEGTYRIVCTEAFGGPGKFTLSVYPRAAVTSGNGTKSDEEKTRGGKGEGNPLKVTVNDVEYVYQGFTRKGEQATVTLLAKSLDGVKQAPQGKMVLVDPEGNQFEGYPIGGFGVPQQLRQGVPLKLTWVFGKRLAFDINPRPVPSAKIKQFASLVVEAGPGGGDTGIEFREVPTVVPASAAR
jgi:hypothetical protein